MHPKKNSDQPHNQRRFQKFLRNIHGRVRPGRILESSDVIETPQLSQPRIVFARKDFFDETARLRDLHPYPQLRLAKDPSMNTQQIILRVMHPQSIAPGERYLCPLRPANRSAL